ncbi:uncharacterized protein LOC128620317 isoform X2 [Ictalurus furcatus]|uniref:uncharacterized protein LOC128620317 isoform X2 n=1 Tax=Ictalurus furcatus TaxID=66913 RepID=UPI002350A5DA|nr:uncharacterized protein LOC128620317 isoform X2 [Ictalurus furcatus]
MMKCLYLLSVVFHVAAGCALSGDKQVDITGHKGGSVLLPCSCSDLDTKTQKFTWWTYRTGPGTKVLNDEHYRGRLQLFNHISPANLSLLISDLREEDAVDYWCSTEKEHRDIKLHVKVGRSETSTHSRKTDTTPPSKPPQSKITNSPPPLSSTTLEQDKQQTHPLVGRTETSTRSRKTDTTPSSEPPQSKTTNSSPASSSTTLEQVFIILAVLLLLLVIPGVVAFICWRRKGGRCGENVITEGRPDCKRKQKDQTEPDVSYSTVTHVNTAGAARVQINAGDKTEYASILTI